MQRSKSRFFDAVARYEANSPVLSKFDIYFRVEDRADIRFWEQMVQPLAQGKRVKFFPYGVRGSNRVTGKSYILKSIPVANAHYILCVDSDFDYLLERDGLSATRYVLQTYTYSWENHHCFAESLQEKWSEFSAGCLPFDFAGFLQRLSGAIYIPLLVLLYAKKHNA